MATTDYTTAKVELSRAIRALDQADACIGDSCRMDVERRDVQVARRLAEDTYTALDDKERDGE